MLTIRLPELVESELTALARHDGISPSNLPATRSQSTSPSDKWTQRLGRSEELNRGESYSIPLAYIMDEYGLERRNK